MLDSDGKERARIEGYLPPDEFRMRLESALARLAFNAKQFKEAEERYAQIAHNLGDKPAAAEAIYWRDVSHYKATNDHTVLGKTAEDLKRRFPDSEWTTRASVWLPGPESKAA